MHGVRGHAPHLIDAELGSVLRRHEQAGLIVPDEAAAALQAGRWLIEHRYPHTGPLADHAWSLRNDLTFYDARMAKAPGVTCTVELVQRAIQRGRSLSSAGRRRLVHRAQSCWASTMRLPQVSSNTAIAPKSVVVGSWVNLAPSSVIRAWSCCRFAVPSMVNGMPAS